MVGDCTEKPDNTIVKKRKTNVGNMINIEKNRQNIDQIEKDINTNNGRQPKTQKNRQCNYKKDKQWLAT